MSTITFDPKDPSTRSFLKEIDVPEDIIESGSITISNALEYQLDDLSFETIASLDGGGSSEFISADEANKALNIFEKYGEKAKATFKSNSCPGTSVLQNMLGLEIQRIFGKIVPERICSYDDNLGPDLQKGIHFIENTVPKSLKSAGEAVGIITFKDGKQKGTGSAVLISQDGDVMTAYHVLYDGNGNFREDVSFEVYGKIVQVKQENITEANRKLDSASFKIEELKEYRTVKIAGRPPIGGEVVWAVGFPSMEDENKKTFTPGKIRQVD
ncbi:MAG: hypothetical protein COV46_08305 [Deltaproteobacteria bacterium CG11_big_fil_rev_8_21_14_0_20_49_13]|nr:MAG: hypothetical protein COV46_08305 [Deltaproteobacteria bacterium CG11_big_fil_rev_8_21_14_0_20_49_13]